MTNPYSVRATGFNAEGTYSPDELVICVEQSGKRTIASGAGVLQRGTVLGKITKAGATAAAKAGGANTGNGTISAVSVAKGVKVGVYQVRFTAATAFNVFDPDGFELTSGATAAAYANDVGFTITAGGTAFVAGDGFDITAAAGSGKLTISAVAATDGSDVPYCVLAEDVDASAADADAAVFLAAQLNANKLIYGTGHSLTTVFDPFRQVDIHLQTALPW